MLSLRNKKAAIRKLMTRMMIRQKTKGKPSSYTLKSLLPWLHRNSTQLNTGRELTP